MRFNLENELEHQTHSRNQNGLEEQEQENNYAIHKIQPIHGSDSLIMVFNRKIASRLQIGRGDYVKCRFKDNQMIVEKINP